MSALLRPLTRPTLHAFRQRYVPDALEPPYPYDAAAVDAEFDAAREAGHVGFAVFLDGEVVGVLTLRGIDRQKGRCTLGILLADERCRGRGLGRAACEQALAYAFDTLGMRAVYAETLGGNARMRRVLERLGFVCYLRMEEAVAIGTGREDLLCFRRLRPSAPDARPEPCPLP